jgi:hypothetical protein
MPELCIIPARILRDPEINYTRLRTALAIGHFTGRDGRGAWASNETLADVAGIDERELRRSISWLVDRGHVRKRPRTSKQGGTMTNVLEIVLSDPIEAVADESPAPVSIGREVGEITPPGGRGKSPHPPRVESPHPGRGNSTLQSTQLNEQGNELPTTTAREGEPNGVGLEAEFADPAHREVYRSLRSTHRNAAIFDLALRSVRNPSTGGAEYSWAEVGAGLLEQGGNGEQFNVSRLRGYCRLQRDVRARHGEQGAKLVASALEHRSRPGEPAVYVGTQLLTRTAFWDLCVRGGLTVAMQSPETRSERIRAMAADGLVQDAGAFDALVAGVEPWALAAIAFGKERDARIDAAFERWNAQRRRVS